VLRAAHHEAASPKKLPDWTGQPWLLASEYRPGATARLFDLLLETLELLRAGTVARAAVASL
jgi:hypothetical protein